MWVCLLPVQQSQCSSCCWTHILYECVYYLGSSHSVHRVVGHIIWVYLLPVQQSQCSSCCWTHIWVCLLPVQQSQCSSCCWTHDMSECITCAAITAVNDTARVGEDVSARYAGQVQFNPGKLQSLCTSLHSLHWIPPQQIISLKSLPGRFLEGNTDVKCYAAISADLFRSIQLWWVCRRN